MAENTGIRALTGEALEVHYPNDVIWTFEGQAASITLNTATGKLRFRPWSGYSPVYDLGVMVHNVACARKVINALVVKGEINILDLDHLDRMADSHTGPFEPKFEQYEMPWMRFSATDRWDDAFIRKLKLNPQEGAYCLCGECPLPKEVTYVKYPCRTGCAGYLL